MRLSYIISSVVCVCSFLLSPLAHAASFYIQEQSVSGLGTAFAGAVADTQDASTVFYNPAGMTELEQTEFYAGAHILIPDAKFKNAGSTSNAALTATVGGNGGNPFDPAVVPNLFFSTPTSIDNLWLGLAVTAPFGLADKYEDDFVGRYNSTESELMVLDVAPSAAYKVNNWLSIGGGLNVQYAKATLKNAIPAPGLTQSTTTDGETSLEGDDVTAGFNAGLLLKPVEGTKIGLHYKQGLSHTLEGHLTNRLPISGLLGGLSGTTSRVVGSAELDLPTIASLGISQKIGSDFTLLGSATWNKWSNFDDIPVQTPTGLSITEQGYENTWSFAVGGRYDVNDKLQLKAGFQYDPTPTVDAFRSTRIPDGDRKWYAAGLTYNVNERLSFDLSGVYVDVSKERVDITDVSPVAGTRSRTVGDTSGSVGIISTGIRYKF